MEKLAEGFKENLTSFFSIFQLCSVDLSALSIFGEWHKTA